MMQLCLCVAKQSHALVALKVPRFHMRAGHTCHISTGRAMRRSR